MSELLLLDVADGIATLTLNRPEKRNAMNDEMRTQLIAALEGVAADTAIRALVLTGAGKGFCAGGDIAGMQERMQVPAGEVAFAGWQRQQRVHRAQSLLHSLPKPTIAAVNGAAAGLGADVALACDFVVASPFASFTWSYIQRGLIPDGGGMYFLPRRVGLAKAKELIFTGSTVDVDMAIALGIADRKTSAERLVADAQAWARELAKNSAAALALTKSILNQSFESSADQVFKEGSQAMGICYTSAEHREAVTAFLARSAAKEK
jgi:2-(1,2-epoxy-1,2-dihydrophenyl)acetyl-CoA isomerase